MVEKATFEFKTILTSVRTSELPPNSTFMHGDFAQSSKAVKQRYSNPCFDVFLRGWQTSLLQILGWGRIKEVY